MNPGSRACLKGARDAISALSHPSGARYSSRHLGRSTAAQTRQVGDQAFELAGGSLISTVVLIWLATQSCAGSIPERPAND